MRSIILLTEWAAEWPAAVPTPVHHPRHPLVAGQAHWLWVVVRTNCSGDIVEQDLPSRDVARSHKKAATPVFMKNSIWQALMMLAVCVLHLAGGGAIPDQRAGGAGQGGDLFRADYTGTTSNHLTR